MSDPRPDLASLEREAAELRSRMAALAMERVKIEEAMARTRQSLSRVHYEMTKLYEAGDVAPPSSNSPRQNPLRIMVSNQCSGTWSEPDPKISERENQ